MNNEVLEKLRNTRGFVFDMDGTLVLGDKRNHGLKPLPGAVEIIEHLNNTGVPYVLLTNGTARPAQAYEPLLREAGLPIREGITMTPSTVAAEYFRRRGHKRILVLGCEGVWRPLRDAGIEVVLPADGQAGGIDAVYVGWYKEFALGDLDGACDAVWRGARLYTASMVPFFASAGGRAIGSSFVIAGMITRLTGARAKTLGKPSLEAMRSARRRLGVKMDAITVVGDDPELEIPMARRGKALGVAVHTGLAGEEEFAAMPPGRGPHLSLSGVDELLRLYREG
jgi:4-nitrophenyl phosphatase